MESSLLSCLYYPPAQKKKGTAAFDTPCANAVYILWACGSNRENQGGLEIKSLVPLGQKMLENDHNKTHCSSNVKPKRESLRFLVMQPSNLTSSHLSPLHLSDWGYVSLPLQSYKRLLVCKTLEGLLLRV